MPRASARAACPSCCSACAAPALLLTPAQHHHSRLQISPEHCLLERARQVHLYWKCRYKLDYESRESKSGIPYRSCTLIFLQSILQAVSQVRSVHVIKNIKAQYHNRDAAWGVMRCNAPSTPPPDLQASARQRKLWAPKAK